MPLIEEVATTILAMLGSVGHEREKEVRQLLYDLDRDARKAEQRRCLKAIDSIEGGYWRARKDIEDGYGEDDC